MEVGGSKTRRWRARDYRFRQESGDDERVGGDRARGELPDSVKNAISGPDEIVIGRDGLLLQRGRQSGVLLPQNRLRARVDKGGVF